MSSLAPAVIVFERRPCWESELKRRLPAREILVRPSRAAGDALTLAQAMRGSVLVVDLAVGLQPALQLLERLMTLRVLVSPIVVSPDSAAELEWPLRELGAVAFVNEAASGQEVADLCRRLLEPAKSLGVVNSQQTRTGSSREPVAADPH